MTNGSHLLDDDGFMQPRLVKTHLEFSQVQHLQGKFN